MNAQEEFTKMKNKITKGIFAGICIVTGLFIANDKPYVSTRFTTIDVGSGLEISV